MATQNYFKAKNGLEAPSQSTIAITDSNFPAVRPTLNLDFAGSESVDSRITFTRASAATYTGADGKLKYAVQNEPRIDYDPVTGECKGLLIEEQRTNISSSHKSSSISHLRTFGISDCAIAPDGTYTALLLQTVPSPSGTACTYIYSTNTVSAGQVYQCSIYIKAGSNTDGALFAIYDSLTTVNYGSCTITWNGTVPSVSAGTVTPVGNGWYRISVSATVPSGYTTMLALVYPSVNANGNKNLYVWGPQFELGSFSTSYIPITPTFTSRASSATYFDSNGTLRIAGTNQARYGYGYDAASGKWVSQGLLLEGAATNLSAYSQNVTNGVYFYNGTIADNNAVAPDGTTTAALLTQSGATTAFTGNSSSFSAVTNGTAYTISYYVKAGTLSSCYILFYGTHFNNNNGVNPAVLFNLTTGTASVSSGPIAGYSITNTGNGWFRVSATCLATSTVSGVSLAQVLRFADPGTSSTMYLWGVQIETGYVATSYIPTYGASATRAADVSSSAATTRSADKPVFGGTAFSSVFNQDESTVIATATIQMSTITNQANVLHIGTDNSVGYGLFRESGSRNYWAHIRNTNSSLVNLNGGTQWNAPAVGKFAFAFKSGDIAVSYSGSAVSSSSVSTSAIAQSSIDRINIGWSGNNEQLNGWIQKIAYYPKRISNAQLQALTA